MDDWTRRAASWINIQAVSRFLCAFFHIELFPFLKKFAIFSFFINLVLLNMFDFSFRTLLIFSHSSISVIFFSTIHLLHSANYYSFTCYNYTVLLCYTLLLLSTRFWHLWSLLLTADTLLFYSLNVTTCHYDCHTQISVLTVDCGKFLLLLPVNN